MRALFQLIARTALVGAGLTLLHIGSSGEKKQPIKPIDLNIATVEQLQQLPGVGPATAKAIVQFRQRSGPFKRVEDLLAIPRITKQRLEKIRPYVTIGQTGPAQKKP